MSEVVRLSAEKVMEKQSELREVLNRLIDDDRLLDQESEEDEDSERENFLDLAVRATLGFGMEKTYHPTWKIDGETVQIRFNTRWRFVKKMAYMEKGESLTFDTENRLKLENPEAEYLWERLRDMFVDVFPLAVNQAFLNSPEREEKTGKTTWEPDED